MVRSSGRAALHRRAPPFWKVVRPTQFVQRALKASASTAEFFVEVRALKCHVLLCLWLVPVCQRGGGRGGEVSIGVSGILSLEITVAHVWHDSSICQTCPIQMALLDSIKTPYCHDPPDTCRVLFKCVSHSYVWHDLITFVKRPTGHVCSATFVTC